MRASLCSLRVPSGVGGRDESDVSGSHTFAQGVLAAITMVEGGARDGMARARASPVLNGHHHPIGGSWCPRYWSRSPEDQVKAGSIPSKCTLSPFLALARLPQMRIMLEQGGWQG